MSICKICGSAVNEVWKERSIKRPLCSTDMQITESSYGQTLTLHKCGSCGFIFAADDEVDELVSLYENMEDLEYETTQDSRALQMQWLLDRTLKVNPSVRKWLDIGAGAGLLVREAQKLGLDAVGVEPSHALVSAAQAINEVELIQGTFPHSALIGQKFDIISLVDVIEHVSSPIELLSQCRRALNPEGLLLVVTPDVGCLMSRLLGKKWWHYRLAHVGYFDRLSFTRAAARAGLMPKNWVRAKWFFSIKYLAERTEVYLPIAHWNRFALKMPPLVWLYNRVIPLNLFDSWVVLLSSNKSVTPILK